MKFDHLRDSYLSRLLAAKPIANGKFVAKENTIATLGVLYGSLDPLTIR